MNNKKCVATVALPVLLSVALTAQAEETERALIDAIKGGTPDFDFRLRYEDVQADAGSAVQGAQALTLRSKAGYATQTWNFMSAGMELTNVTALPDDDNYFSGSNDQTDDVFVPDPEGTELNQIWWAYDVSNTLMKYGRQELELDNGRFIGTENWRQNENTVSGLTVQNETLDFLRISAGLLHRSEGILGDDAEGGFSDVDAHYLHAKYRGFLNSFLSIYMLDIDNNDGADVWDSRTQGIRYAGKVNNEPALEYILEYAIQSDGADNPNNYRASYYLFEAGVTVQGIKLSWGREMLGADDAGYFVVPLGAKDSFQGWTNQFWNGGLGNIEGGIIDQYAGLGYSWDKHSDVLFTHHIFDADETTNGISNLGKEWGIHASQKWKNYRCSIGFADYQADQFGEDSRTFWISAGANF